MFNSFKLNEDEIKSCSENIYQKGNVVCGHLRNLDSTFKSAASVINSLSEISHMNYNSLDGRIKELQRINEKIERFKKLPKEYKSEVDKDFFKGQEKQSDRLSNIVLNNIGVEDTLGLKKDAVIYDEFGTAIECRQPVTLEDILNESSVNNALKDAYKKNIEEIKELQDFANIDIDNLGDGYSEEDKEKLKEAQNQIKEYLKAIDADNLTSISYEKDLEKFLSSDNMNYVTKGERTLSIVLDFVPVVGTVKGLAEAGAGEDLITGEKLSSGERVMCAVFSVLNLKAEGALIKSVGKAAVKNGAKSAVKYAGKEVIKETTRNAAFYGGSVALAEAGFDQKYQLGLMAAVTVVGHAKTIKGTYSEVSAKVKGVSKGSFLDDLRVKDKVTYKKVVNNLSEVTRVKTPALSCNGVKGIEDLVESNKGFRKVVKNLEKCNLTKSQKGSVTNLIANGDKKTILEFKNTVLNGSKDDIIKSIKKYENSFEFSKFGNMSLEDGIKYRDFLEHGSKRGLTKEELAGINKVNDALALKKVNGNELLELRKENAKIKYKIRDIIIEKERVKYYESLKLGVIDDTAWEYLNKYANKNDIDLNKLSWDEKSRLLDQYTKKILNDPEAMSIVDLKSRKLLELSDCRLKELNANGYDSIDYYTILNTSKDKREAKDYFKTLENTKIIKKWENEFYGNDSKFVISYMPKDAYEKFVLEYGTIGRGGEKGGQFVLPQGVSEAIESKLSKYGSIDSTTDEFKKELAKELGLPVNVFKNGVVKVEIPLKEDILLRMVTGIEDGCNYQWIPGGKTIGGTTEGIIRQINRTDDSELFNIIITRIKNRYKNIGKGD